METVEERSIINPTVYAAKPNTVEESTVVVVESSICHKPNGVDVSDSKIEGQTINENVINYSDSVHREEISVEPVNDNLAVKADVIEAPEVNESEPIVECVSIEEGENTVNNSLNQEHVAEVSEALTEVTIDSVGNETTEVVCEEVVTESTVEVRNFETSSKDVKFKTEILVEKNDSDVNQNIESCEPNPTNNILIDIDHNIELSEVLQSDVTDDNDNNSGSMKGGRHEVFNKEELLDILEGNDNDQSTPDEKEIIDHGGKHSSEAEIALKQLSRLAAKGRVKINSRNKKGDKKPASVKKPANTETIISRKSDREGAKQQNTDKTISLPKAPENDKVPEAENIVSALVMDWDDDEPADTKDNTLNDTVKEEKGVEQPSEPSAIPNVEESINQVVLDSSTTITTTIISTEESSQSSKKMDGEGPPRRISRVIKKKVIFDPDNPDTFTKGKTPLKNKEVSENNPTKKPKPEEIRQRSKSKSPMSKSQWKKPSPKNSKQNKRLSEVDKLLMDEGAVNMLYQLTPDAPKGKKNMRSKAEIIKKLQSSTPETKEMKFRERKKELIKEEDGEAKRILGGKHRISLSSSVKSPQVCDDFETHSADDSIIYRRHSSSSYSSSCMSPRRLSDVETGSVLTIQQAREIAEGKFPTKDISEAFMADSEDISLGPEIINKSDCLSIKEKLNSKLSQVLNKRKRDSNKIDKPTKQKRVSKTDSESCNEGSEQFKFISIALENSLAVVCIKKPTVKIGIEVIRELEEALLYLDKVKYISVTFLSSECLVLCSSLDLNIILEENKETRVKQAYKLADSIRSLLSSAAQHSKLLCCGVWGACSGVGLALVSLSDITLASECATFALAMGSAPLLPGTAALTARCQTLPQALINDLVIFGRKISSSEALRSGLISRALWPDRFKEQVYNIVKDIASQPPHTIILKKKLLNMKKSSEEATLLSCLEAERDLLVEYWTSVEGQELLRATLH